MKLFLKKVSLFLFFTFVLYLFFLFIWGSNYVPATLKPNLKYEIITPGYTNTRLKEVKSKKDLDILIIGSSITYSGFDTRNFKKQGFESFNLGTIAQRPIQTTVLLQRYLKRLHPKIVIYAVEPEMFTGDNVESSLDIIRNDKNDIYSAKMAFVVNHMKVYNALLYGFVRDVFHLNSQFVEPTQQFNTRYIPGGYVESKMEPYRDIGSPERFKINEKIIAQFEEVVSIINKNNIKLILVYPPVRSIYTITNINNYSFDDIMSAHGDYYDFNEILNLKDSVHFIHKTHLNQEGVRIFNDKLLEVLNKDLSEINKIR